MSKIDFEARVNRGAALLDRVRPGWAKEIALDRLAMDECADCILGQLYGEYSRTIERIVGGRTHGERWRQAAEHGFTITPEEQYGAPPFASREAWEELAYTWRVAIRARA